jgi:hypothetical protein
MTPEDAAVYRKRYSRESKIFQNTYKDIFIFGGKTYLSVMQSNKFKQSEGRIGERLAQLKIWLNNEINSENDKV